MLLRLSANEAPNFSGAKKMCFCYYQPPPPLIMLKLITLVLAATSSLLLFQPTHARPYFRDRIPNGRNVPNPYIPGSVWSGVGHFNVGGGGPRNPFGLDFAAEGFTWTVDLCEMDSDNDGRTNGQELGDPNCIWVEGGDEPEFPAHSHPGIVDEVDEESDDDGRDTDTCKDYADNLPSAENVHTLDIAFSKPNELDGTEERTKYICEQFRVSSPDPWYSYYHQIKTEPMVDNENVLHHMWIYACDGETSSDGNRVGQGAYECNGIEANCHIVAGWAVGGNEELCEPPNVGAGIMFNGGILGDKLVFKVEAHYDLQMNDNGNADTPSAPQTDQSGMRLTMTSELRPIESGQVILGMDYYDRQFTLEPGQTSNNPVSRTNICPTEATMEALGDQTIYVYSWNPHMHLYGKSLVTEHYRCGEKIGEMKRMLPPIK